jgi:hypothetical protein
MTLTHGPKALTASPAARNFPSKVMMLPYVPGLRKRRSEVFELCCSGHGSLAGGRVWRFKVSGLVGRASRNLRWKIEFNGGSVGDVI